MSGTAQSEFEEAESAFDQEARNLSESISEIRLCTKGQERGKFHRQAQVHAQKAEEEIQKMSKAKDNMAPREKRNAAQKLRQYRADLDEQRQNLKREMERSERQELLSSEGSSTGQARNQQKYTQQRDQLLQTQQKVDKGTSSLRRAQQQLVESQQMGSEGLETIHDQGKQLEAMRERVQHTTVLARAGGAILRRMKCRAVVHKAVLVVIMIVLFAAIVALIVVLAKN